MTDHPRRTTTVTRSAPPPAGNRPGAHTMPFARLAPATLVLGPALLATSGLVHPEVVGDDAGAIAAAIGTQATAWQLWSVLVLAGCLLAVPGALRVLRFVGHGRGTRLVTTGAALLVAGAAGAGGFAVLNSILVTMVPTGIPPDPAVLEAIARSESDPVASLVVLLFFIGVHAGWPVLLAGAARAGLAHRWQWVLAAAGSVAVFALSSVDLLIEAGGLLAIAVAAAPTARRLRRGTDQS